MKQGKRTKGRHSTGRQSFLILVSVVAVELLQTVWHPIWRRAAEQTRGGICRDQWCIAIAG